MKLSTAALVIVSGVSLCATAQAARSIAPLAPWSPRADAMVAQWSKLSHHHLTKEAVMKNSCHFPSAAAVGVKAYPGSRAVDWTGGGGSAADSDDVPMVELVSKAPLQKVAAWYKTHYPRLKAKYEFETAGPGINYLTADKAQYKHQPAAIAAAFQSGDFSGCGGLLEAPAAFRTAVRIYYRPHGH